MLVVSKKCFYAKRCIYLETIINNEEMKYHHKTIALCYSEAEKSLSCGNFSRNFEVHTRVVVDKKFLYARKS